MAESKRACDHCGAFEGAEGVQLKRCSRCVRALYCSQQCQKAAWRQHRQTCNRLLLPSGGITVVGPAPSADSVLDDAPEPPPGGWRFGEPMELPKLDLPFPLTRAGFEASLPDLCKLAQFLYNVGMTGGGKCSPENSPPHGIFLHSIRAGERVPGGGNAIATKDETRWKVVCFTTTEGPEPGQERERLLSTMMQYNIDEYRAHAALCLLEMRERKLPQFEVRFEGLTVTALCPGVRRTFLLDMTAGGRRQGQLVKVEAAVESDEPMLAPVFITRHPRFYPASAMA